MKKLFAIAAVTIASASAYAGVSATIRGDYVNTPEFESRDINTGSKVTGSSIFRGALFNLDVTGKVGEANFDGELNLGSLTSYASGDVLVNHAVLSKEFGSGFTVGAGKLNSLNGGFEYKSIIVGDVYLATLANGGIGGYLAGTTGAAGIASEQFAWLLGSGPVTSAGKSRGVSVGYKMGDNNFDLQVTNSTNHGGATATYRRNNIGLYYTGSFADKMIMPMIGYMSGSRDTTTAGFEDTYISVGAKMKFGMTGVLVEYLSNATKASATGGKTDGVTSLYALVDYTMDAWKPFLKFESSEFKSQDDSTLAASFKRTAFNLGVEMMPKANDAFRYHLAYVNTSDKYGTAGTKETVSWSQLIAGVKYSADLLK